MAVHCFEEDLFAEGVKRIVVDQAGIIYCLSAVGGALVLVLELLSKLNVATEVKVVHHVLQVVLEEHRGGVVPKVGKQLRHVGHVLLQELV